MWLQSSFRVGVISGGLHWLTEPGTLYQPSALPTRPGRLTFDRYDLTAAVMVRITRSSGGHGVGTVGRGREGGGRGGLGVEA